MSNELEGKNNPKAIGGDADGEQKFDKQTPPTACNAPNTPNKSATTLQNKEKRNFQYYWKKTNKFAKDWKYVIELAGLIGLIVYCALNAGELWVFNRERTTMEQEFRSSQTNSIQQLKVLQEQLNQMRQATELDERAWIYVQTLDNSLVPEGTNYVFNIPIKNFGKTAALVTGSFARMALDTKQIPLHDAEIAGAAYVLAPNNSTRLPMSVPQLAVAYTGIGPIYIYGTIWYSDIVGGKHWTQFCYELTASGQTTSQMIIHCLTDDMEKAKDE